jgi:GNAT superfamily N-acetyltransferase
VIVKISTRADAAAVAGLHGRAWGGSVVVGHGVVHDLTTLPTLVAVDADRVVGALAYRVDEDGLEVVSIVVEAPPHRGVGSALLAAAIDLARAVGAHRLWLVTTNDNLDALRFYQRRGLRLVALAPAAVDAARRLKPELPEIGAYGIPLRDELTLEMVVTQ